MQVEYKNDKLRKVCTIAYYAQRQYGEKMSYKIHQRIDELRAASSVEELLKFHIGRCHLLQGDRKGQYAMDLIHPYRLIFAKLGNEIEIVNVIEIIDYH